MGTGKAPRAYVYSSVEDSVKCDVVKKSILNRHSLTEEGYRQRFRDSCLEKGETVVQFFFHMCFYFERWPGVVVIAKEFSALKDLILHEQFLGKCKPGLIMFLKERTPKSVIDMILTEQYNLSHGGPMWDAVKLS